jgi:hypothetical protein
MLQKNLSKIHFYEKVKMITKGSFVVESFSPLAQFIMIATYFSQKHNIFKNRMSLTMFRELAYKYFELSDVHINFDIYKNQIAKKISNIYQWNHKIP